MGKEEIKGNGSSFIGVFGTVWVKELNGDQQERADLKRGCALGEELELMTLGLRMSCRERKINLA